MNNKSKEHQSDNLSQMSDENYSIDDEKFVNSWLIFSFSFLVSLLILWFITKDNFFTGIISFILSSILVIGYNIKLNF